MALGSGWSREVAALLGILALAVPRQSYQLTSGFSAYAGGDFAFHVQPIGSKRFRLVGGIEFADVANAGP